MNKFLRKALVIMLVLVMAIGVMAGCGSSKENNEGTTTTVAAASSTAAEPAKPAEPVVVKYKSVIYGPDISVDDPVQNSWFAQQLLEKFNVKFVSEGTKGADADQALTAFFAAGADADILGFWLTDTQMPMIKKAAADGMLADLKESIANNAPNLQPVIDPKNIDPALKDTFIYAPEYGDKVYFLPSGSTATGVSLGMQDHGASIRKDIVEKLGIDPQKITTSEELYQLLKDIKALNLKDLRGKPLIPASTWEVGWDINNFSRSYDFGHRTAWAPYGADNKVTHWFMTDWAEKKIFFIRKLIAEGLLDKECITQNVNTSLEKIANGSIGVFGLNPGVPNTSNPDLLKQHPEFEFVELGPLKNYFGEVKKYQQAIANQALTVMSTSKNLDTVVKVIDYFNSPEGRIMAQYGEEGKTYNKNAEGFPRLTDEYFKMTQDANLKTDKDALEAEVGYQIKAALVELGIPNGGHDVLETFGEAQPGQGNTPGALEKWKRMVSIYTPEQVIVKGFNVRALEQKAPQAEKMGPVLSQLGEVVQRAYYAKTEAEAQKIINDFRKIMKDNGYDDMEKWINEECAKNKDNMIYYLNW